MANVALCWELGGYSGHVVKLAEYIKPLKEQGHRICLIVQDIQTVSSIPLFDGLDIYQAPLLASSNASYKPVNYASILFMCGYDEPKNISIAVKAWCLLYRDANIDFVIGEHSPTSILAAKCMDLPHAVTGGGFMVPPLEETMPSIMVWEDISLAELQRSDQLTLNSINQALSIIDGKHKTFERMRDVFSSAHQWLTTYPEADHYGVREQTYIAPNSLTLHESQLPSWPEHESAQDKEKVFIYLNHKSNQIEKILTQLNGSKYSVLAVVTGWSEATIDQYSSDNVKVQTQLVNIAEVAKQSKLIITNAGYSTVIDFLLLGIPILLVPMQVESTMFSYRMGLQKLSFASHPNNPNIDILSMLETVKRVDVIWENARKFADKYRDRGNLTPLSEVIKTQITQRQG